MASPKTEKATFACGCFWGVQAAFDRVKGVVKTTVGYTGGHLGKPTYEDVCTGRTGHAEAIEVEFDPKRTTYEKLLGTFFSSHDPTQVNRQGPDAGSQYRSAIFYHDGAQKKAASKAKDALEKQKKYSKPIATEVVKASAFYPAEEHHQKYLEKRGQLVCH
ncbi:TPA: peptide-methionine (S)-S-oxide reductase MsrA [Candidatus Woesearchaeota archaeon]|nr:peptide-methionine (S)-S-oxide reductase MsrA [Candidatus Woesearchaeota archaeon]HIJ18802.1 peptide-methionine (S)-S-oxide reductase MsrA [Candidatus Woesearchaeota archaeon]